MAIDLNELATALGQLILRFRLRRRTAAAWTSSNEVLLNSEMGYETDTGKLKIGDGTTAWNDLGYWGSESRLVAGTGISLDEVVIDDIAYTQITNTATGGGGGGGNLDLNLTLVGA